MDTVILHKMNYEQYCYIQAKKTKPKERDWDKAMLAVGHGAELWRRLKGHGFYASCKSSFLEWSKRGRGAHLERRDVGMGHVAVHILDLR